MDDKIIEAEIISETIHEEGKKTAPKKVKTSDHSRAIAVYTKLYVFCLRFGFSLFLLFLFGGFAFSILYSQATNRPLFLSLMIVFWVFCGISLILWILGFFFRKRANYWMSQDPNYKDMSL